MPLDPSIPLSTIGGDPKALMSLLDLSMKLRANQQAVQAQNALKDVFSNPENLDPSGLPNQAAISKIYAINPQYGMEISKNMLGLQAQKSKLMESKLAFVQEGMDAALNAYEDAKKAGLPEQAALAKGQETYSDYYKQAGTSGLFSPQELEGKQQFNPDKARAFVLSYKDRLNIDRQKVGKTPEEQTFDQFKKEHPDATAAQEADFVSKLKQSEKTPNIQSIAMNKFLEENPNATAEEIAQFAQKTRAAPRSPAAMATQRYMQEHPDATSDDIAKFASNLGAEVSATRAFATGPQGNTVRSMNVAVQHLDTLGELGQALNNGDTKKFNQLKNYIKDQFGYEAPGNFDAAKIVIGNEIIKAVIGAAGALGDREEAQRNIDSAKSWPQLKGVIDTYQKLMAGQLNGLQRQYEQSTKQKDFDKLLEPRTIEVMKKHGYTPEGRGDSGAKTSAATPPASLLAEGVTKSLRNPANGLIEKWTLRNGVPQKVP